MVIGSRRAANSVSAVAAVALAKRRGKGFRGGGTRRLVRDVGRGSAFAHGLDTVHRSGDVRVGPGKGQHGPVPVEHADEEPAPVDTDDFKFAGR